MADPTDHNESLVDLHLDLLTAAEAEAVRARIRACPELAAQSDRCRRLLANLDTYASPAAPEDLVERILNRVSSSEQLIPFPVPPGPSPLPNGMQRGVSSHPVLSLRELLTVAACLALFLGVLVPGFYKARDINRRTLCQRNEQRIYTGLASYATAHAGLLPHAGVVPGGSWLRTRIPGITRASNTRHVYLLLRDGFVPAGAFTCPGAGGIPMIAEDYRLASDFAEPANCTYSTQNVNVSNPLPLAKLSNRMAYVADPNPYFSDYPPSGYFPRGPVENSHAHDVNAGQNVLYVDGHTGWVTRPNVGVNNDHIYRAGTIIRYIGNEVPQGWSDSFLVP